MAAKTAKTAPRPAASSGSGAKTKSKAAATGARDVAALAEAVLRHKRAYYAGKPEISDAAYDRLEDQLRALAPSHPVLATVGTAPASDLPKVAHSEPMLSLQKTYDQAELIRWAGTEPVMGTLKIDGVSLSLIYRGKDLVLAKTRGNGVVGEDVTVKARWAAGVPGHLDLPGSGATVSGEIEIRGELYCREGRFVQLADDMEALGLDRPTSPRNIVAGLLGRKIYHELARYFDFYAFSVVSRGGDLKLASEEAQMQWLGERGFSLPHPRLVVGEAGITAYLSEVQALMSEDEIPADGAVFSVNSLSRQHALGNTSHHPRFKMSFKWQGQTAQTTIRSLFWATSRLGIVTPVAIVDAVVLSGASITNVTLHNAAHVKTFNLKAGDGIEIVRSGEVIPKFLQVTKAAPGDYVWPEHCSACGSALVFDDVRLKCPNSAACPAQQMGQILNWIRAAEIDDLSEKRLTALMDAGLVRTMVDLYKLRLDDFFQIPQTKDKMAAKLKANIDKSRKLPLAAFLSGLGIEGAGQTTWEKLLAEWPRLADLQATTPAQIAAVDGFAELSAQQIADGLAAKAPLIQALLAAGVEPTAAPVLSGDGPLSGMQLVVTGALSRPRAVVEKAIKAAGGKLSGTVSKATTAVVTEEPESTSSKMVKARTLGIPVWSERDLWQQIGREPE